MKLVNIKDPKFLEILEGFTEEFFTQGFDEYLENSDKKFKLDEGNNVLSDNFLNRALNDKIEKYGYPTELIGYELSIPQVFDNKELRDLIDYYKKEFDEYLGFPQMALLSYYPKGGKIGWHHNGNAAGYNMIFSMSLEGDGYFKHYDHVNNVYHTYKDKGPKQWSFKAGYFGNYENLDKIFWHCAEAKSPRITISFILDDETMWNDVIEEIGDSS